MSRDPAVKQLNAVALLRYGAEAAVFFAVIGFFGMFSLDSASAMWIW